MAMKTSLYRAIVREPSALISVYYNGYVEYSMQGYSKGTLGLFITVDYNS
jgi:hypothetical protein